MTSKTDCLNVLIQTVSQHPNDLDAQARLYRELLRTEMERLERETRAD